MAFTLGPPEVGLFDADDTLYGGVRFLDFPNRADGAQVYLGTPDLGTPSHRVEAGWRQWRADVQSFSFSYIPHRDGDARDGDTIATSVNAVTLTNSIATPARWVNYIEVTTPFSDAGSPPILNLRVTDLSGNELHAPALDPDFQRAGRPGWRLTDPALLAHGFIVTGAMDLSGFAAPRPKGPSAIEIDFGHSEHVHFYAGDILPKPPGPFENQLGDNAPFIPVTLPPGGPVVPTLLTARPPFIGFPPPPTPIGKESPTQSTPEPLLGPPIRQIPVPEKGETLLLLSLGLTGLHRLRRMLGKT